jgi:hypothetical protein
MTRYKVVPFSSGSAGLDRLVSKIQDMPKHRIAAPMSVSGAPCQGALTGCLDAITRITKLSGKSPGAGSIPQALQIGWNVYAWMQMWVSVNPIIAKSPTTTTVSYQAVLDDIGKV